MRKISLIASALALASAMACTAGAVNVGTINNGYPGDTEAQAQMLCDLGLFKGTDEGFQLDQPMTRAQAAVMLARLLGEEEKVLAGTWNHPFTDVPQWAGPYVGWLYQNGLTKGVSETEYGASRKVTCAQYCVFLARASKESEEYIIVSDGEVENCDAAGFLRGDAVSLSAKLLTTYYGKDNNSDGISVAQKLIEQGVFTKEQFRDAAWDVLPREYERRDNRGTSANAADTKLSCLIAGVPVARNEETEVGAIWLPGEANQVYGSLSREDGTYSLFLIDPKTLATTQIATYTGDRMVSLLGKANGIDYLMLQSYTDDNRLVISVRNTEVQELDLPVVSSNNYNEGELYAFNCKNGIGVIDANGAREVKLPEKNSKICAVTGGRIITQAVTKDQTILSCLMPDGSVTDSYAVENVYAVPGEDNHPEGDDLDYWELEYAPRITSSGNGYLWGSAGLYQVQDGHLDQLTKRGVYDFEIDEADNSIVAVATEPSDRAGYSGGGMLINFTGNEVIRIAADGTETVLLSNTPAHGLTLDKVTYAHNGTVRVQHTYIMGMADTHAYEYAIEDGRPRPLVHRMGNGFSGYSEEECEQEQQRLDEIYTADGK